MGLCAMKLVDFLNKACCGARETISFNKPPVKCSLSTALRGTCWQMPRIYVQP